MTEEMKMKRAQLKDLSAAFRVLVKDGVYGTVNEGLANYYAAEGHTTLKSFRRWKEEGFKIKKGSKALLFWGEPKTHNKPQEQEPPPEEDKDSKFYPLAYLFSQMHVEQL